MVKKKYKRTNIHGLGGGLNSLIGSAGSAVGSGISGGFQSKAGNALNGLGGVASAIPGPWGAVASATLKTIGGLFNRMFGSQINEEAVANFKAENATASNQSFNAATTEDLMNQNLRLLGSINKDEVGKDGWFSNTVANLTKDLNNKRTMANNQAVGNFNSAVNSVDTNNDFMALGNYSAFGGPLQSYGGDWSNGLISIDNGGSHEGNPYEGVPMGTDQNGTPNLVEEGETVFMDYVFSKRLSVPKAIREKYKLRGTKNLSFADASKKLAKESEERPNDPISQRGLEAAMADLAMEQEKLRSRNPQQQVNKFDTGGPFNSYGYVSGYNGGWYGADGRYTQEYLDRVNALTTEQLQAQFDDQYSFYSDDANKGSDRWKAIDAFYKANPQYKKSGYKITADDVARAKRLGQDNKPGYMHYLVNNATTPAQQPTPTAALNRYYLRTPKEEGGYELTEIEAPYSGVNAETGMTWAEANPNLVAAYNGAGTVRDAVDVDGVPTTYTDYYFDTKPAEAPAEKVDLTPAEYKHRWEGLRYAPAIGLGISSILDLAGVTNKPDYSNADAILEAARDAGTYQPVKFNPIGDYMTYNPFDRNFYSNKLEAQTGATKRAIINQSAGNRATAVAGLLAADYNAQSQMGDLYRKAEEYNLAQRHQVGTFNRATNQANSEGFLKAAMANQDAAMKARGLGLEAQMRGYQMREAARLASDEAKAANLSGLIESLGAIGMDNAALNARDFALATGTFGPVNPGYEYILTGRRQKRGYGGKLNRGRKGLTC